MPTRLTISGSCIARIFIFFLLVRHRDIQAETSQIRDRDLLMVSRRAAVRCSVSKVAF
jgi:hypothetical protein